MSFGLVAVPLDGALCPGERWYAVYTLRHRESTAKLQLGNQGFRTFMESAMLDGEDYRSIKVR